MVVEDHHVVRAGLITLLGMAPDLEVVAEAGDAVEAEEQFRMHSPDVILIDLRLCGCSGAEVIKNLRCKSEKTRFVVLTAHAGEEDVYRAIQAGARAYLLKGTTHDELIETIRLVHSGRSYFPVEIAATLAKRLRGEELTARETDVLVKITRGMSNRRIATLLQISEATVKAHVNSLLNKLGVADRTQAVTVALQRGIVTLDSRDLDRRATKKRRSLR